MVEKTEKLLNGLKRLGYSQRKKGIGNTEPSLTKDDRIFLEINFAGDFVSGNREVPEDYCYVAYAFVVRDNVNREQRHKMIYEDRWRFISIKPFIQTYCGSEELLSYEEFRRMSQSRPFRTAKCIDKKVDKLNGILDDKLPIEKLFELRRNPEAYYVFAE